MKTARPGRFAVVADIEENWTTPVDVQMQAIGGCVFRHDLSEVRHATNDEHIAATKDDFAQMKAKHVTAHSERNAQLQNAITRLDVKLETQLLEADQRHREDEWEEKTNPEILDTDTIVDKAKMDQTHTEDE